MDLTSLESPRVLIADDQPHVLDALRLLLKGEGFVPEAVSTPAAVMQALQDRNFDVLLLDLNYARDTTSGGEGLELLSQIRNLDSSLPVVLMTAWASIELAVRAMQGGGRDFVQKPWDNEKLLASLRHHIEEGRVLREQKRERDEARQIQSRLMPAAVPQVSGSEIQTFWKPVGEVGGDYFDAITLEGSATAFCIADVGGKGLPAALLMSNMQAGVRAIARTTTSPAIMCRELNRFVVENTRSGRLTTFFYGIVDWQRQTIRYSNAGHLPPLLVRKDGNIDQLSDGGIVFGVGCDMDYKEVEVGFSDGDHLVLLTDGITEAPNKAGDEFGYARVIDLLRQSRHLPAAGLQQKILHALDAWAVNGLQDDATLVTIGLARKENALRYE